MLLDELVRAELVAHATDQGYAHNLTDEEIEKIGCDPFLIAYALVDIEQRRVVTTERSRPGKQRANRNIPDVCRELRVPCCDTFEFLRALNFTTRWNA